MNNFLLVSIVLFISTPISSDLKSEFIIWNVGQGQWVTYITPKICYHIDAGGEHMTWKLLFEKCHHKKNYVALSHWDWDHINFLKKLKKTTLHSCISHKPAGPNHNYNKLKLIQSYKPCLTKNSLIKEIPVTVVPFANKNPNDYSRVFQILNRFLIPGDSPKSLEKQWSLHLKSHNRIHYLILGHHGSNTSTSKTLLNRLPHLYVAISSSRKKRYGHPHPFVLQRLKKNKTPILTTENWGHIIFEL